MDLLAHLEAYVATVDETSFSRAADRLGIAQPLLSRRIKTLEARFGGLLFDRSRRQVATTELGMLLLPYARDVLDRAQRLDQAARSAQRAQVRAVGVPADCAPAELARVIRAGAERGSTLGVRELPPREREARLADGSLAFALLRVPPEHAAYRVPLGLASAPPLDAGGPSHATPPLDAGRPAHTTPPLEAGRPAHATPGGARGRAVHLEDLRPRRLGAATGARTAPLPILTLPEDDVPYARDRLGRAAARSGLPEQLVRPAGPAATALAETLAGRALLLCDEPFARRHGADWAPLADAALHRGYEVRGTPRQPSGDVPQWLAAALAAAAGAGTGARAARPPGSADAASRLAARG
ncbi:LysR family transcriptional regulator [Streptomyces sp. 1-11]|uniref:LysR family transcriptional regulator n=1 Tax=Streptomyces sp. 1-11 TaxID=2590549 RepID=UPI00116E6F5E|nr:LysR family transcriptional regulator [Streptomyces sp. 1-11]GEK01458.1 LysR family transcriptional regulator [Streptomyces sp. 1-11]